MTPPVVMTPAGEGPDPIEPEELWDVIRRLHRNGFISPVTTRLSFIPNWAYSFIHVITGQRERTESGYGYRINFADMHRMYMSHLQAQLIDAATTLHFDRARDITEAEVEAMDSTLRKYGAAAHSRVKIVVCLFANKRCD